MILKLYNTLNKKIEDFIPIDKKNIRMYVCGPTVYDSPHIGNARSVVVYDVLFRLLKYIYGDKAINYVRNITDVDDKIIAASKEKQESVAKLTQKVYECFTKDMTYLNCQSPVYEPKATDHIYDMIQMIEKLLQYGCAYLSNDHIYFDVSKFPNYNNLSGRSFEESEAGYRIAISEDKRNPADFVLWKPAEKDDDLDSTFDSPWGLGRPGWHIECSAMSTKYLGSTFDIHGGGIDLIFPHHTNEIAQSVCSHPNSEYAKYWVHNGFLTVNGEKMSKSIGNFITVKELKDLGVNGESIRLFFLMTHYRKPINWTKKGLGDSKKSLDSLYRIINENHEIQDVQVDQKFLHSLCEDINTPKAIARLHEIAKDYNNAQSVEEKLQIASVIKKSGSLIGLFEAKKESADNQISEEIESLIKERLLAKKEKNWKLADEIRDNLMKQGIMLEDTPDGNTSWRYTK